MILSTARQWNITLAMHGRKRFSGSVVTKYTTRTKCHKQVEKTCLLVLVQHKTKKHEQNKRQWSISKIMFEITSQGRETTLTLPAHAKSNVLENTRYIPNFSSSWHEAWNKFFRLYQHRSGIFCCAKHNKHVFSSCSFPSFLIFYVTTMPWKFFQPCNSVLCPIIEMYSISAKTAMPKHIIYTSVLK